MGGTYSQGFQAEVSPMQTQLLNEQKTDIIQLHFGGGTPTFLSDEEMTLLITEIKKYFNFCVIFF